MPLQDWERAAIKDYHPLVRTPRGATRFLNTYRLLRAGLAETDWSEFLGRTPTGLAEDRYAKSSEYMEVSEFVAGKKPAGAGTIGSLFAIHHMNTIIDNAPSAAGSTVVEGGETAEAVGGDRESAAPCPTFQTSDRHCAHAS